jgi:hypothetical protein
MVQTSPDNQHIFQKVLHAEHIIDKIDHLIQSSPNPNLTPYQIRKMSQLLLDQHTSAHFDALTYYSIRPNELVQRVPCPQCQTQILQRIYGNWLCPKCHTKSADEHQMVVRDHLLLRGPMSNGQLRQALKIESIHTVRRLMEAMGIPMKGRNKGRVYFLEE